MSKYLTRSNDRELAFETPESAIEYFLLDNPENQTELRYNIELQACSTLEQVATVYNRYTDLLLDGSTLLVLGTSTEISDSVYSAICELMNDDIRNSVSEELAPCTKEAFLTRYIEKDPAFEDILRSEFSIDL